MKRVQRIAIVALALGGSAWAHAAEPLAQSEAEAQGLTPLPAAEAPAEDTPVVAPADVEAPAMDVHSAPSSPTLLPDGTDVGVRVEGMVCQFCASGIERLMNREDRIEAFEVSFDDAMVFVTFAQGDAMNEDELRRLIRRAGYDSPGVVWR